MQTGQCVRTAAGSSHWLSGSAEEAMVVGAVAERPEVTHLQARRKKITTRQNKRQANSAKTELGSLSHSIALPLKYSHACCF